MRSKVGKWGKEMLVGWFHTKAQSITKSTKACVNSLWYFVPLSESKLTNFLASEQRQCLNSRLFLYL